MRTFRCAWILWLQVILHTREESMLTLLESPTEEDSERFNGMGHEKMLGFIEQQVESISNAADRIMKGESNDEIETGLGDDVTGSIDEESEGQAPVAGDTTDIDSLDITDEILQKNLKELVADLKSVVDKLRAREIEPNEVAEEVKILLKAIVQKASDEMGGRKGTNIEIIRSSQAAIETAIEEMALESSTPGFGSY